MNQEAVGGGIGAVLGGFILQKLVEASSVTQPINSIRWMPPLLIVLGIFIIIAGIADIE